MYRAIWSAVLVVMFVSGCSLRSEEGQANTSAGGAQAAKLPGYTAEALVRIAMTPDRVSEGPGKVDEFEYKTFRATQRAMATSRLVLLATLCDKTVVALKLREKTADRVAWLAERLQVEIVDDSELMRISVTCDDPEEARILTQAVLNAYLDEIVNVDHRQRRDRLNELDRIYADDEQELRRTLHNIEVLGEQLGDRTKESIDIKICREQAQQSQEALHGIATARNRLRIEQRAVPRVTLFIPAETPTKKN